MYFLDIMKKNKNQLRILKEKKKKLMLEKYLTIVLFEGN